MSTEGNRVGYRLPGFRLHRDPDQTRPVKERCISACCLIVWLHCFNDMHILQTCLQTQ